MNNGIDVDFVRETYRKMTDKELERIATEDAVGLTPEAQEVVKEEVERRGLNMAIVHGVQAQNQEHTIVEIDFYCALIRDMECPSCGSSDTKLNGTLTSEVVSAIVITFSTKKTKIACPSCLDKANNSALFKTALLGWWSIRGIIRTVQALSANIKSKQTNHLEEPNAYMRGFVMSRIGRFETYKNDRERLREIIAAE